MTGKSKIRGIFFDLGGVLVEKGKYDEVIWREVTRSGIPRSRFWRIVGEENDDLEKGKETSVRFWRRVSGRLHIRPLPVGTLKRLFREPFKRYAGVNRRVLTVARRLRAHGYPVGIISNTIDDHTVIMKKWKLLNYFDVVLLSNEVGCKKPQRAIFTRASRGIGIPPRHLLFVDDTPKMIAGARACGFTTILFKSPQQLKTRLKALKILS